MMIVIIYSYILILSCFIIMMTFVIVVGAILIVDHIVMEKERGAKRVCLFVRYFSD